MPRVTTEDARSVGDKLDVNWETVPPHVWRKALEIELEHTDVTGGDLLTTGKIALAHLKEFPDYYQRLVIMEKKADAHWKGKTKPPVVGGGELARILLWSALILLLILVVWAFVKSSAPTPGWRVSLGETVTW